MRKRSTELKCKIYIFFKSWDKYPCPLLCLYAIIEKSKFGNMVYLLKSTTGYDYHFFINGWKYHWNLVLKLFKINNIYVINFKLSFVLWNMDVTIYTDIKVREFKLHFNIHYILIWVCLFQVFLRIFKYYELYCKCFFCFEIISFFPLKMIGFEPVEHIFSVFPLSYLSLSSNLQLSRNTNYIMLII